MFLSSERIYNVQASVMHVCQYVDLEQSHARCYARYYVKLLKGTTVNCDHSQVFLNINAQKKLMKNALL
jgi:hypothetical protein